MSQNEKSFEERLNDSSQSTRAQSSDLTRKIERLREEIASNRKLFEEMLEDARRLEKQGEKEETHFFKRVIMCKALERVILNDEQELEKLLEEAKGQSL